MSPTRRVSAGHRTAKKGVIPQVVLNNLYKYTSLQTTFGANNLALVNGVPKCLSLREMLQHYIDHQVDVVTPPHPLRP